MSELTIGQLIKIVIGVVVVVVVIVGVYLFFKNDIFSFFNNLGDNKMGNAFLPLLTKI